jgi:hypothetical protein
MTTARMFCRAIAVLTLWTSCGGAVHAFDYNGWWEIVGQGQTGINVGQQGDQAFIAWFTYDETGKPTWLNAGGPLSNPTTLTGALYRHTGPALGTPFNPALVVEKSVGTFTLNFSDLHHATFAWTFNGKSGSFQLQRESYGTVSPAGFYSGAEGAAGRTTATPVCVYNGSSVARPTSFSIGIDANTMTINQLDSSIFQGAYQPSGEWVQVPSGTYTSSESFGGGTFTASVLAIDHRTLVQLTLTPSALPGCVVTKTFVGFH